MKQQELMKNNFRFKGMMKMKMKMEEKKEEEKGYELRNWMKFIEQSPFSNNQGIGFFKNPWYDLQQECKQTDD